MAEITGRVMTLAHHCYDERGYLPSKTTGKLAGEGNRTPALVIFDFRFSIADCNRNKWQSLPGNHVVGLRAAYRVPVNVIAVRS